MGRKSDLQDELDALGIEWASGDTIAVLEEKLAAGQEDAPVVQTGMAADSEEDARVDRVFVTVVAPPSWARSNWQPAFLTTPLRFNRDARAQLLVEQGGEPVVFAFMGPSGMEAVPIADKVAEHPDFEVVV